MATGPVHDANSAMAPQRPWAAKDFTGRRCMGQGVVDWAGAADGDISPSALAVAAAMF